jgi:hypothetical protein
MPGADENIFGFRVVVVQQPPNDLAPYAPITEETSSCIHTSQPVPEP